MNFNQGPYTIDHTRYVAGMVADGEVNNTISKVNDSAQVLQYGRFVARAGDNGMMPLVAATTAGNILGVLRYELNRAQGGQASVVGVPSDRDGSVLTMGAVAVETITVATSGSPVFVVVGDGTNDANVGKVANAAGTGANTAIALPGAVFTEAATANSLTKISIKIGG